MSQFIADNALCPLTGQSLKFESGHLSSAAFGVFPKSFSVPWIFKNPHEQILQWRYKIASVSDSFEAESLRATDELRKVDLLPSTKIRLENLSKACVESKSYFANLRKDLDVLAPEIAQNQKVYFEKVPKQQTLLAYHDTVFRDWVWGQNELDLQADFFKACLKDTKKLLVLGAGACGLPATIHQRQGSIETLCVDINPVLLQTVKKLVAGEDVYLVEYPKVPVELKYAAVHHKISAQNLKLQNFHLALGDAQSLEFKAESFDTVLTPWLIDIVPRDFREFCRHLNQSLPKGGRWLNIGLLDFRKYRLNEIYSPQEVKEALIEAGFKIEKFEIHRIPYLQSPYAMVGRLDQVVVFSAIKEKTCKKPARFEYLPDWLRDWKLPIPLVPEIRNFQVKSAVFANTIGMVNGTVGLESLSQSLATQFKLPIEAARESVYNFMVNVYEQNIYREY